MLVQKDKALDFDKLLIIIVLQMDSKYIQIINSNVQVDGMRMVLLY